MINSYNKIYLLIILMLAFLLLRDMPYINVLIINKIWAAYIICFALVLFSFISLKVRSILIFLTILFLTSIVLNILRFYSISEISGIIIYFLLWFLAISKIKFLINSSD